MRFLLRLYLFWACYLQSLDATFTTAHNEQRPGAPIPP